MNPDNKNTYVCENNTTEEQELSFVQDTEQKINKIKEEKRYLNVSQIFSSSVSISPTQLNEVQVPEVAEYTTQSTNTIPLNFILAEIITTEEQYVKNLNSLIYTFIEILSREPIFNCLKYYLKNLLDIHSKLLVKIKNVNIESLNTSIIKVDIITGLVVNSVSIYFYENYIKIYYIILQMLKEQKTHLVKTISNLNNTIYLTQCRDRQQIHQNISFESLLQEPLNSIIRYKTFFSRILLNNITSYFNRSSIAKNVNDLLIKLEKINNFELDYATTIRTKKNYAINEFGGKAPNKTFDPNFRYNNVIQKIIKTDENIEILTFGPIILLQPVIVYYIESKSEKIKNSKFKNLISKFLPNKREVSLFQVAYKDNCIALLFKSHLLILEPSNSSNNGLKTIFCIPLAISKITTLFVDGIMTNFENTLKLIYGYNLVKFEMLLTSWNKIEFENFSSKLQYLAEFYNSNEKSTSQGILEPLTMESLEKKKLSNVNDINHTVNQIVQPINIAIKDINLTSINKDKLFKKSYFNQIFLINANCSNYSEYQNDYMWIWHKLNTQINKNSENTDILINVNSRICIENFLLQHNMWFSDVDMLKLAHYKQHHLFSSYSKFSKRNLFKIPFPRGHNLARACSARSSTTVSDKSLLFLPTSRVLNDICQLRTSLIVNSESINGCSYFSGPTRAVKLITSKRFHSLSYKSCKTALKKKNSISSSSASTAKTTKYLSVVAKWKLEEDESRNLDIEKAHIHSDDTILNKCKYTKSMEKLFLLKEPNFPTKKNVPNVDEIIEQYVSGRQQSK